MEKIYFYVHYHGGAFSNEENTEKFANKFGILYYEWISSPFPTLENVIRSYVHRIDLNSGWQIDLAPVTR